MFTSWFLAVDFQFYLITPFFVYLIYNKPSFGYLVTVIVILISLIATSLITYIKDLPPIKIFIDMDPVSFNDYKIWIQQMPFTHLAPAFCGIILGCLVNEQKHWFNLNRVFNHN